MSGGGKIPRMSKVTPLLSALTLTLSLALPACGDDDSTDAPATGCSDPACYDVPGGGVRCVCDDPEAEPAYEPQPQPWAPETRPLLRPSEKVQVVR